LCIFRVSDDVQEIFAERLERSKIEAHVIEGIVVPPETVKAQQVDQHKQSPHQLHQHRQQQKLLQQLLQQQQQKQQLQRLQMQNISQQQQQPHLVHQQHFNQPRHQKAHAMEPQSTLYQQQHEAIEEHQQSHTLQPQSLSHRQQQQQLLLLQQQQQQLYDHSSSQQRHRDDDHPDSHPSGSHLSKQDASIHQAMLPGYQQGYIWKTVSQQAIQQSYQQQFHHSDPLQIPSPNQHQRPPIARSKNSSAADPSREVNSSRSSHSLIPHSLRLKPPLPSRPTTPDQFDSSKKRNSTQVSTPVTTKTSVKSKEKSPTSAETQVTSPNSIRAPLKWPASTGSKVKSPSSTRRSSAQHARSPVPTKRRASSLYDSDSEYEDDNDDVASLSSFSSEEQSANQRLEPFSFSQVSFDVYYNNLIAISTH
jgi:hypothetical protein